LIKGLKDSDSSLLSNEKFSKIFVSSGWAPGQVTWANMAKNLLHLHHWQKTQKQKQLLFYCNLEDLPNFLMVWTAL